jgi:hypothetical protein
MFLLSGLLELGISQGNVSRDDALARSKKLFLSLSSSL